MRKAVMLGRLYRSTLAAAALLGTGSCAGAELRPASDAVPAPLRGEAAVAEDAGVHVAASAGAWQARPANLETELTPVLIDVLNRSGRRADPGAWRSARDVLIDGAPILTLEVRC